jgi:hypothetical protein
MGGTPQQLIQDSIDSWFSRLRKVNKPKLGHWVIGSHFFTFLGKK